MPIGSKSVFTKVTGKFFVDFDACCIKLLKWFIVNFSTLVTGQCSLCALDENEAVASIARHSFRSTCFIELKAQHLKKATLTCV